MTDQIKSLPWHVNVDAEGYQETSEELEEHWNLVVHYEQRHGALFYAGIANRAAQMMGYPDEVQQEVPDDAETSANMVVAVVKHDDSEGTAQALYGLVADASDFQAEYAEAHGEENVQPLADHVEAIRERWQTYKNGAKQ